MCIIHTGANRKKYSWVSQYFLGLRFADSPVCYPFPFSVWGHHSRDATSVGPSPLTNTQAWAMGWTYLPCRYIARAYEDRGTGQDELGFGVDIPRYANYCTRVCSVTFRLHDNKGTTFVSLYRLSRPQTPPTFLREYIFLPWFTAIRKM